MATTAVTSRNDGDAAAAASGVAGGRRLRVFFFPSFARGHLIPQTDLACLMAAARPGELEATMVVSPANASVIAPTVGRAAAAGHAVRVLLCPFPEVGLGDGVECLSTAPARDAWRVYRAMELVRPAHESLLWEHRPDAIISDVPFWWTMEVAAELGVPRLTFHPVGVFPQLAMNNLFTMRSEIIQINSADAGVVVSVPGLPGKEIMIPVSELPSFLVQDDHLSSSWEQIKACQLDGFGVIVNTFVDLEQSYCEEFSRVDARRAYFVGPLAAQPSCSAVHRGGDGNAECLSWLSTKPSRSVVYVCFGSWAHFSATQSKELALGLEASNQPFLWVVRSDGSDESNQWMPEGWEQRVAGRGMVVRGWAPQVAVLAHMSVGAFLTHCGWNSVLEAASAGVPVLTWPLVFEQFINERLVTDVAAFGARVWDGGTRGERAGEAETTVPADAIARAVAGFMERGARRERMEAWAGELAERARGAVGENGSSWRDIHRLIDDLVQERALSGSPQDKEA
ncbi:unnamed protein product [Urochloa humidicola]